MGWLHRKLDKQPPKVLKVKYIAVLDEDGDVISYSEVGLRVLYPGDTIDIHYKITNELGPKKVRP